MNDLISNDWSVQFNAPPDLFFLDILFKMFELGISVKLWPNFTVVISWFAFLTGKFLNNLYEGCER